MKHSKLNFKVYLFALFLALITVGIIMFFFRSDSKTNQKNLEYINSFGWEVNETPEEIVRLTIPDTFDTVYNAYNDLGKAGGFDLDLYKGSGATRYSYRVLNHINSPNGLIRINLFLIKGEIAAAFIYSLEPDGFIAPISDTSGLVSYNIN